MESILTPATPVAPPAPWFGGKRLLANRIIDRIAAIPHVAYVEPFLGMGGVFFRRPFRSKSEVINDLSQDVSNLFRVLQRHYVPLMDLLRWQITSRTEFDRLRAAEPSTLTDLERAARFLYIQRTAFSGLVRGAFAVDATAGARFDVSRLGPILDGVHQRLTGVVIERLPYPELIRRYDKPATLFYVDPPTGAEKAPTGLDYSPEQTSSNSQPNWRASRGGSSSP